MSETETESFRRTSDDAARLGHPSYVWRAGQERRLALVRQWAQLEGARILDAGCGVGMYTEQFRRFSPRVTGVEIDLTVARQARSRLPGIVVAPAEALPFADGSFDVVVSNSTLDHFATRGEIQIALAELRRVLRPGGRLLLTLDNLANPLIALRNAVPFRLLRRLRLLDYPVGATMGPRRLRRVLQREGFDVLDTATLLHCPRALAVARARRLELAGTAEARARFLDRLAWWERFARLPTRYLTGHYIGVSARKV